jgi:N-acetylglucosamine kinase-like BadF-type ATPase
VSSATPAVLAVDGGNSKAQVALVAADGTLLSCIRGPSISHQAVGLEPGMANLRSIVDDALGAAGPNGGTSAGRVAEIGVYCLAGADYPSDVRLLETAIAELRLTSETLVHNDTFAALRAGTHRPWGIALICGQGINGAGVAPDGRSLRFDGLGDISGDWGGGRGIGTAGLGAAVRARDGRGRPTLLERLVPEHFGLRSIDTVVRALYDGRIDNGRLGEIAPVVFRAAEAGDAVARSILDRLVDELVVMATALIRRLRMTKLDPDVVLAGGVFRATDPVFYAGIESGIRAVAPDARTVRLTAPPVLGSALLGLDRVHAGATPPEVDARIRAALEGRHDG